MRSRVTPFAILVSTALCIWAGLEGSYVLPLDHQAIQYGKVSGEDPVARLNQRITEGTAKLEYHSELGYLPSVLKELSVPSSSQVLVFSKTSFQAAKISPKLPRALYFNDDVSLGYVRGGDVLEFAAVDAKQGVVFYTLDQGQVAKPQFMRQDTACLQCHAAGSTLGVPGLIVRSVYPDRSGMPIFQAGSFITDYRSPLKERWGGWYVTGTHGERHLGNRTFDDTTARSEGAVLDSRETLAGLIDAGAWPEPSSDIVALMTLEHQTRVQNVLTRVAWETRIAMFQQEGINKALAEPAGTLSESTSRRIGNLAEEVVLNLLFSGEAPLVGKITGSARFAADYVKVGPRDKKGRSLREFDLTRRLLKYPCSPLIYSQAYRNLPEVLRTKVNERLRQVLSSENREAAFAHLSAADRTNIREILADTGALI